MKKIIRFAIATSAIFVLMLPWTTASSADEITSIADARLGLWSRQDQIWVHFLRSNKERDSSLTTSTIYIPPENFASRTPFTKETWFHFYDDGRPRWVLVKDLTSKPVESEMWRKLLIKAKIGGYSYFYDFLQEIICRTPSESAPVVMNNLYNDIQLAFACNTREFPTSPQGIYYCLEEYTRLKLAGRVPVNDLDEETRLIEGGRPAFRKVILLPSSLIYRQYY